MAGYLLKARHSKAHAAADTGKCVLLISPGTNQRLLVKRVNFQPLGDTGAGAPAQYSIGVASAAGSGGGANTPVLLPPIPDPSTFRSTALSDSGGAFSVEPTIARTVAEISTHEQQPTSWVPDPNLWPDGMPIEADEHLAIVYVSSRASLTTVYEVIYEE